MKIVCSGEVSKVEDRDENNDFFNKIGLFNKMQRRSQDVYSCTEHKDHLVTAGFKNKYIFRATCMGIHHIGGRRIAKTTDRRPVTLKKSKEAKYYLDELLPCDSYICVTCNFRCDKDLKKEKTKAASSQMEIDSNDDEEEMEEDEEFIPEESPSKKTKGDESGFVDMDTSEIIADSESKDPKLELLKELATMNGFSVNLLLCLFYDF